MARWQIVALMRAKRVRGLDIGAIAGVSQATVTRVIARKDVSEDKRERVWLALEEAFGNPLPVDCGVPGDPAP
jgi:hypothetical protein